VGGFAAVLTDRVQRWQAGGRMAHVAERRLFLREHEGGQPLLLFLHGFPSSSYDWRGVLELLPGHATLAFDFLGFGLSEKPREHLYSLMWQADATEALVAAAAPESVFVVAHDMGTSVATELMARDLRGELEMRIAGILLFNGSILLDRASPTIGQRLLRSPLGPLFGRLTSEAAFRREFARLFSRDHPLGREEAEDQWALLAHAAGNRIAHRLIHYMDERERLTERWHGAFRDWAGELSLAWGLQDPVATVRVLDGLRELRPHIPVTELPKLGHYPQLEDPPAIADVLRAALRQ
jgi:pimeloyl-ACP methyl ester carboxylesterase